MITIVPGNASIRSLISQRYNSNNHYLFSKYLIRDDVDEGVLVLNTISGEVVLLSSEECIAVENSQTDNEELLSELVKHGFIVPEQSDEKKRIEQLREIILKECEHKKIITFYNILTTTACNARCFYCYQYGIKHVMMSMETAEKVVQFIVSHHGGKKIILAWFGGEPTLNIRCIDYICSRLNSMNILFSSRIVSNAYLFDRDMVKHAKEFWNLKTIQITLDGTEKVYNKTKAYVNITDNAYYRVLRNTQYFLDEEIDVNIRLNMDEFNAEDLNHLVDELNERFGGQKHLAVYVRLLNEDVGSQPVNHNSEEKEKLKHQYVELQKKLEINGRSQIWNFSLPQLKTFCCMADDPNSIQITPDGIFSKCEDQIYNHTVGSFAEGVHNSGEIRWWQERKPYTECADCVLFPSCAHQLKNCPIREAECPAEEKTRRIKMCHETMRKMYTQWKQNHDK